MALTTTATTEVGAKWGDNGDVGVSRNVVREATSVFIGGRGLFNCFSVRRPFSRNGKGSNGNVARFRRSLKR